jgi:hypothetical protein
MALLSDIDRRTPVLELQVAFSIPCVYDCITKLCSKQAEVFQDHLNPNVRTTGQVEATHRKSKRLQLGGGQAYDRLGDCRFGVVKYFKA